jgi:hypothetical protein
MKKKEREEGTDLALVVGLEGVEDLDLVLVLLRLGLPRQILVFSLEFDRVSLGARSEVHFLWVSRTLFCISTKSLTLARTLNDRMRRRAAHRVGKEVMGADPCDKGVAEFGIVERDVVLDDPECLGPHELFEQLALLFLRVIGNNSSSQSLLHCSSVLGCLEPP